MGGKFSRDKGLRGERFLVNKLKESGFAAERVPLSGAAGNSFSGDLNIPLLGVNRRAEVKCRAHGFAQLYQWLDKNDLLIVKGDRQSPLVVIPLELAMEIALAAEKRHEDQA